MSRQYNRAGANRKSKRTHSVRNTRTGRNKRIRFGVPRKSQQIAIERASNENMPPEDWHEPTNQPGSEFQLVVKDPGEGYVHVVTADEVRQRLDALPTWMIQNLDVVQLSRMTRKKLRAPLYGMQWGTTLYLYPIEDSLTETYYAPPSPALKVETRMYGGVWKHLAPTTWELTWNPHTIKDYYLNNILIHELGHLLDERNTSYVDRERYAEWFAIQYGYLPTRNDTSSTFSPQKQSRRRVKRRHHAK